MDDYGQIPARMSEEPPAGFVAPARVLVDAETWKWIVDEIENPGEPSPALRSLMARGTHDQD